MNVQSLNANAIVAAQDVLGISKCKYFVVFHHHQSITLSTP